MSKKEKIAIAVSTILALALTIAGISAYFSDEEQSYNRFTVGHNVIEIEEKFVPPTTWDVGINAFQKSVSVKNGADSVPCYVRVAAEFSSDDIAKISGMSNTNGTTYYSAIKEGVASITAADGSADTTGAKTGIDPHAFIQNMGPSSDWVYISEAEDALLGGYYYYKPRLETAGTTSPLFTNVLTYFKSERDMVPYDIYVMSESVQSRNSAGVEFSGTDPWKQAWTEFLSTGRQ